MRPPKPTKADRFRASAKKFAASKKNYKDVNDIVVAGWAAMQMGEGLVFAEVEQIIKDELGDDVCRRNDWCKKGYGHGDGCSIIG